MAIKSFVFLFISLLLVSARVSSKDEELLEATNAIVPSWSPLKATSPAIIPVKLPPPAPVPIKVPPPAPIPVKAPPPPAPVQVKAPPPPAPVPVKLPPPPAPPVKPPVLVPPVQPPPTSVPTPPRNTKECYSPCLVRCKLHSRKNVCLRACVTCCDRCKCVPPGQYGNREKCGKCYVNMTTRGGRPKCP